MLLAGVILAVALLDPSKVLPGTSWHPWLYLREAVMLALLRALAVLRVRPTRKDERFQFRGHHRSGGAVFWHLHLYATCVQILNAQGTRLGLNHPQQFFWATGTLSSFLDNAPTYLVFFEVANAMTQSPGPGILALQSGHFIREDLLRAISLGAVFMGAMTYIGNGPNFMVKSIAESQGVRMPSFFGYMIYSCVILLPLFILLNVLFL